MRLIIKTDFIMPCFYFCTLDLYFGFLQGIIPAAYHGNGRHRTFQLLHLFGRERNLRGTEVLLQMRQLRGAGDRNDELTLVHQPSEGDLCRRVAACPSELVQHFHDAQVLAYGFGLEAGQSLAVVVGTELRVFVYQSAKETTVDRTVRHEADA